MSDARFAPAGGAFPLEIGDQVVPASPERGTVVARDDNGPRGERRVCVRYPGMEPLWMLATAVRRVS